VTKQINRIRPTECNWKKNCLEKNRNGLPGPLHGIKILDFTEVLSGPYCTQLLGDLGADVYKVEPPWGDGTRKWGPPFVSKESAYYLSINRNKKSLVIDLSNEKEGKQVAIRLAKRCDVVIESFRPSVMAKLKLGYEDIKKENPNVIYCSISGYGQSGPMSHKPGYDIAAFAASGIMSITGEEQGSPVKTGVPIADIGAGLNAALAISAALFRRERTGKGTYIDVSLYDAMLSWLTFQAGYYFVTGKNPKKLGSAHPLLVPYQAFEAKDSRYFILAIGSDTIWQRACKAMKQDDLAQDKRFLTASSRLLHRNELIELLQTTFKNRKASYWLRVFDKAGVPSDAIRTVSEALSSEHTRKRKLIVEMKFGNRKIRSIGSPIHFGDVTNSQNSSSTPPRLGEHTVEILKEFGFSKKEIARLLKEKVVVPASKK
jgi:crotonobetainyl-CoA:carnitine CoA-transferase CaiB-like acyl-CoA transferase